MAMPGNVRPVADERDNLMAYLDQQRYGIRLTAYGLTEAQARATPTASALSVGGLIKHVTATERTWMNYVLQRPSPSNAQSYLDDFRLGSDETLADVLVDNVRCGEETAAVIAGVDDLGQPVPVPRDAPWFPADVEAWSVRWVLLHVIEEVARHAGHADIIREHLDGGTMYPIMAAAEGWPASPWMQPWQPTDDQRHPARREP
jgi:hypothetical protein